MGKMKDLFIDKMNTRKKADFNELDDGSVECLHCGMFTSSEEVEKDEILHWKDCPMLIDDADFSGADSVIGYPSDR